MAWQPYGNTKPFAKQGAHQGGRVVVRPTLVELDDGGGQLHIRGVHDTSVTR
jgi:hypothetical protein